MKHKFILPIALFAFVFAIVATVVLADRDTLTITTAPTAYATSGTTITWTAADPYNYDQFLSTGRELLLVRNDSGDTQTITVSSVADQFGRTGDATKAVADGAYAVFQMFPTHGWQQSSGYVYVDGADTDVYLAVIRVP